MKLISISDTHGLHGSLEILDGDILIHAGDLTRHGVLEDVREFNDFLGTLPHPYKIVIAGFILYLPQSLVTQGWQLLVLQASVGVAIGGITPGISALLTRYTPAGEEGAVFGLDSSVQAGARTVAPLLGASVATWISLRSTFIVTALLCLLAGVLAFWILPKRAIPHQD